MPNNKKTQEEYIAHCVENILHVDRETALISKLDDIRYIKIMTSDDNYRPIFSLLCTLYEAYVSLPMRKKEFDSASTEHTQLMLNIFEEIQYCRALCEQENTDIVSDAERAQKLIKNIVRIEMPRFIELSALLNNMDTDLANSTNVESFRKNIFILEKALKRLPVATDRVIHDVREICDKCFNILNRCLSELEVLLANDKKCADENKERMESFKKEIFELIPLVNAKFPQREEQSQNISAQNSPVASEHTDSNSIEHGSNESSSSRSNSTQSSPVRNDAANKAKKPVLYSENRTYTPASYQPAPQTNAYARQSTPNKDREHKKTCAIV